jgi:hypothetical protein
MRLSCRISEASRSAVLDHTLATMPAGTRKMYKPVWDEFLVRSRLLAVFLLA